MHKYILCLNGLLLLISTSLSAQVAKPQEEVLKIDLGGVHLGDDAADIVKLANSKRRGLVGPGKRLVSAESKIKVTNYIVGKAKNLGNLRGVRRQEFMFLNKKLIGVELWYGSSHSYKSYLNKLEKLGYEEVSKDKDTVVYKGTVSEGDHKGAEILVTGSVTKGFKGRKTYVVNVRSFTILGSKYTEEAIEKAQESGKKKKQNNRALDSLM